MAVAAATPVDEDERKHAAEVRARLRRMAYPKGERHYLSVKEKLTGPDRAYPFGFADDPATGALGLARSLWTIDASEAPPVLRDRPDRDRYVLMQRGT